MTSSWGGPVMGFPGTAGWAPSRVQLASASVNYYFKFEVVPQLIRHDRLGRSVIRHDALWSRAPPRVLQGNDRMAPVTEHPIGSCGLVDRSRAFARGHIQSKDDGSTFVAVPTVSAGRAKAMVRSFRLHQQHDELTGRCSHYVRQATSGARGLLSEDPFRNALRTHQLANAAKHSWSPAADPLQLNDPWRKFVRTTACPVTPPGPSATSESLPSAGEGQVEAFQPLVLERLARIELLLADLLHLPAALAATAQEPIGTAGPSKNVVEPFATTELFTDAVIEAAAPFRRLVMLAATLESHQTTAESSRQPALPADVAVGTAESIKSLSHKTSAEMPTGLPTVTLESHTTDLTDETIESLKRFGLSTATFESHEAPAEMPTDLADETAESLQFLLLSAATPESPNTSAEMLTDFTDATAESPMKVVLPVTGTIRHDVLWGGGGSNWKRPPRPRSLGLSSAPLRVGRFESTLSQLSFAGVKGRWPEE